MPLPIVPAPTTPTRPSVSDGVHSPPSSTRRRYDSEQQARRPPSGETEASHYSDGPGSPVRRSTSLRSKLSFSALRSPKAQTRDEGTLAAADRLAALGAPTLVVDAEDPAPPRLGLAADLATRLAARCVPLGGLDAGAIRAATG